MNQSTNRILLVAMMVLSMTLTAWADDTSSPCETDADCPSGFSCDVVWSMGTTCVCPEGEEECACDEDSTTTEEWKECRPKACQTDAECGDELKCHLYKDECPDTLAPQLECPEEEPDCNKEIPKGEPCEPSVKGVCGPSWLGTCDSADDCGPGFDCAPVEICECSGTSSAGSVPANSTDPDGSDGASTDPAPAPDDEGSGKADEGKGEGEDDNCDCKPSDESYCNLIKTACDTDADCALDGWTCAEENASVGVCTFNAETGEEDCEEIDGEKACVPPGYEAWGAGSVDFDGDTAANLDNGKGNDESAQPTAGGPEDSSSGGCRVGDAPATGLFPLAVFLLLLMWRRRLPVRE